MGETRVQHQTCSICEAMCGILVEHRDGEVLSIKPNPDDVLSHGHICPKAVALKDLHTDPDRLRRPLRRTAQGWEEIDWATAFETIERRIGEIRAAHGHDAVALYAGNPTVHNLGAMLNVGRFIRAVRTKNLYSATSVDQLPHMVASLGDVRSPVPGACAGRRSHATVRLHRRQSGGVRWLPHERARVREADRRAAPARRPFRGRRPAPDRVRRHRRRVPGDPAREPTSSCCSRCCTRSSRPAWSTSGISPHVSTAPTSCVTRVLSFEPQALAARTGIAPARIAALAREIAAEPRALVYGRVGACTQEFGGLTLWLIYCLNVVTGHLDREGGMMFAEPPVDLTRAYGSRGHYGKFRSRVRGLPEFSNELPVAALAEEIESPGPGQVRALITFAGNPVLSTPNGRQLDRALDKLDFMVSIDLYLNETTRHAHLILPPTSPLERSHYDVALSGFAVRNVAKYSPALFRSRRARCTITKSSRNSHCDLRDAGRRAAPLGEARRGWLARRMGPDGTLDWMLKTGKYGSPNRGAMRMLAALPGMSSVRAQLDAPDRRPHGLSVAKLAASRNGIDLGPLQPCLERRLATRGRAHRSLRRRCTWPTSIAPARCCTRRRRSSR